MLLIHHDDFAAGIDYHSAGAFGLLHAASMPYVSCCPCRYRTPPVKHHKILWRISSMSKRCGQVWVSSKTFLVLSISSPERTGGAVPDRNETQILILHFIPPPVAECLLTL